MGERYRWSRGTELGPAELALLERIDGKEDPDTCEDCGLESTIVRYNYWRHKYQCLVCNEEMQMEVEHRSRADSVLTTGIYGDRVTAALLMKGPMTNKEITGVIRKPSEDFEKLRGSVQRTTSKYAKKYDGFEKTGNRGRENVYEVKPSEADYFIRSIIKHVGFGELLE